MFIIIQIILLSSTPGKCSPKLAACCGVLARYTEAQLLLPNPLSEHLFDLRSLLRNAPLSDKENEIVQPLRVTCPQSGSSVRWTSSLSLRTWTRFPLLGGSHIFLLKFFEFGQCLRFILHKKPTRTSRSHRVTIDFASLIEVFLTGPKTSECTSSKGSFALYWDCW